MRSAVQIASLHPSYAQSGQEIGEAGSMVYPHIRYDGPAYLAGPQPALPTATRELDSRCSDGIEVRLLWREPDGQILVAVHDRKTGELFELLVRDGDRALDVFHHPYAYAARCRRAGEPSLAA